MGLKFKVNFQCNFITDAKFVRLSSYLSSLGLSAIFLAILLPLSSCQNVQSDSPTGDIKVQIPVTEIDSKSVNDSSGENQTNLKGPQVIYTLKPVALSKITSLNDMSGAYVKFYLTPGNIQNEISGVSPLAFFIKLKNSIYVPRDENSLTMATLYYHLQNLTLFSKNFLNTQLTQEPVKVGLKTQISEIPELAQNNAFFDGQTKAIYFVPYTLADLPISVNAGIIAHEYFHSIFFDLVFKDLDFEKKSGVDAHKHPSQNLSSDSVHAFEGWKPNLKKHLDMIGSDQSMIVKDVLIDTRKLRNRNHSDSSEINAESSELNEEVNLVSTAELYNMTYLRGLNEGLADFWAWVYTTDPDFIRWSLRTGTQTRSLQDNNQPVSYISQNSILNSVKEALSSFNETGQNPTTTLTEEIYKIGTPYARFLKKYVEIKSESEKIELSKAKFEIAQLVINFLLQTSQQVKSLGESDLLKADSLFIFLSEQESKFLNLEKCEHIISYLNSSIEDSNEKLSCELLTNESYRIKKNEAATSL